MRLVAGLAPVPRSQAQTIPPFVPSKLYANSTPLEENDRPDAVQEAEVTLRELNGILPDEDGQEMDAQEVVALVARTIEEATDAAGGEILAERGSRASDAPVPQTTVLAKTSFEQEDQADDTRVLPAVKVQRGDTLARILARAGGQTLQVRSMIDVARPLFPETALLPGFEVRNHRGPLDGQVDRGAGSLQRFR